MALAISPAIARHFRCAFWWFLVMTHIANWKITILNGKSHHNWPFSIAMWNCQRVISEIELQNSEMNSARRCSNIPPQTWVFRNLSLNYSRTWIEMHLKLDIENQNQWMGFQCLYWSRLPLKKHGTRKHTRDVGFQHLSGQTGGRRWDLPNLHPLKVFHRDGSWRLFLKKCPPYWPYILFRPFGKLSVCYWK